MKKFAVSKRSRILSWVSTATVWPSFAASWFIQNGDPGSGWVGTGLALGLTCSLAAVASYVADYRSQGGGSK